MSLNILAHRSWYFNFFCLGKSVNYIVLILHYFILQKKLHKYLFLCQNKVKFFKIIKVLLRVFVFETLFKSSYSTKTLNFNIIHMRSLWLYTGKCQFFIHLIGL